MLTNLKVSAEFDMRHRGLFEYYGKDLIAYKNNYRFQRNCNEFLRDFSKYMTDYLEDNCPPAWDKCNASFWEELIFAYIPLILKVTPQRKEAEKFLSQLKHFVRWLDRRIGTSWYGVVENYVRQAKPALVQCEQLLNEIFLTDFPKLYQDDWDFKLDIEESEQEFQETTDRLSSVFEVTGVMEDVVLVNELKTKHCYQLQGLPNPFLFPGMLLDGVLGKRNDELFYRWFLTNNLFPAGAKKFIVVI